MTEKRALPKGLWWPIAVVLIIAQLALHYQKTNQSDNWFFYEHAERRLIDLPPNALLLTSGDTDSHTLQYIQECESLRDDVTVVLVAHFVHDAHRSSAQLLDHLEPLGSVERVDPALKGSWHT